MTPATSTSGARAGATGSADEARRSPPLVTGMDTLVLTSWFAVAAGLAELVVWAFRKFVQHQFVEFDAQIVWLTPLSYVVLMLPLGLVLAVSTRGPSRVWSGRAAIFLPALVGAFSVAFMFYPALHKVAVVVLSLGVAIQAARMAEPRLGRFLAFARRSLAWAIGAIALVALVFNGWLLLSERRALAALPAVDPDRPSIVVLVLDTVRSISMSLYGYARTTTPEMAAIAAGGTTFRYAFSTSPWTLPGHVAILAGRYPFESGAGWTSPLDGSATTLAERLREEGYATGGFVANLAYATREVGLAQGFIRYEDYPLEPAALLVSSSLGRFVGNNPTLRSLVGYHDILARRTAADVNASMLDWAEDLSGRPFFAFINYYDAHEPYLPPPEWEARFGGEGRDKDMIRYTSPRMAERAGKRNMSPEQAREEEEAYEGALAWLDAEIGNLVRDMEVRGLLDNTILVITSDHGELFGEHGLYTHGHSLYAPLLNVPLVILGPGVEAGRIEDAPVTLRDLPATLLGLAGIEQSDIPGAPLPAVVPGAGPEISPIFAEVEPAPNGQEWVPSAEGPMHSVVRDSLHYIRYGDGREELYDYIRDPDQLRDLSSDPASRLPLASIRETVDSLLTTRRP